MSQIYKGNKIIHRSKNLRGIIDHARNVGAPERVRLTKRRSATPTDTQPYVMSLFFSDGTHGRANWASEIVAARWLANRRIWRTLFTIDRISTKAFRDECARLGVAA